MNPRFHLLLLVVGVWPALAQERELPIEDAIKQKAGHFRLTGAWIGGGIYSLRSRSGANLPSQLGYSESAGLGLNWSFVGLRTNAWATYSGDYSLSSQASLQSLSQLGEVGFLRRVTPRFSVGMVARAQDSNIGSRLFQQPQAARQLQSEGFGGGLGTGGGLGSSADPIGEAVSTVPNTSVFGLTLGARQRAYTTGLVVGMNLTPRTDIRLGVSGSISALPQTPGINVQLPYSAARGGYLQGTVRHRMSERTSVNLGVQAGQNRGQGEKFNSYSGSLGLSRTLSSALYVYGSAGGGTSTAFRNGVSVPGLPQYTGQAGLGYIGPRQGLLIMGIHDAGDRLALGFLSTSQLNAFWNFRPPASAWALSVRGGGVLLRSQGAKTVHAGSAQVGLSRRLRGNVYSLLEATYVTNVLFAPQRLFQTTGSSPLDTSAQRAARLSIVYRPTPDRK